MQILNKKNKKEQKKYSESKMGRALRKMEKKIENEKLKMKNWKWKIENVVETIVRRYIWDK